MRILRKIVFFLTFTTAYGRGQNSSAADEVPARLAVLIDGASLFLWRKFIGHQQHGPVV
jgi:hypothetical protein